MKCIKSVVLTLVVSLVAVSTFAGRTCTWTGAQDGCWTNAANWAGGVVPGVLWDGTGTPGFPSGDVAVFGASSVTTIDCTGLYSISNVTISGASAPAYTFTTSDEWTALSLEPGGSLRIESTVLNDQTVSVTALANLALSSSDEAKAHPECYGTKAYFYNYSANTLNFTRFDAVRRRPGHKDTWQNYYIYFYGNGDYSLSGYGHLGGTSPEVYLYHKGQFDVNCDFTGICHLVSQNGNTVNIAADCKVATSPTINSPTVVAEGGTFTINGPGLLSLGDNQGAVSLDRRGYLGAYSGTTLQINCPVTSVTTKSDPACVHVYTSSGTINFNTPTNTIPGTMNLESSFSGTVVFPSTNNLGTMTGFIFASKNAGATVRFDGSDDESLVLPIAYTNGTRAVVKNGGTGTFTVTSTISASGATGTEATAEFCGAAGRLVFAPTFSAVTPKTFRFSGAAGVELSAATAAALPSGTALQLDGGTTLWLADAAAYALPALTSVSGANALAVPAGASLTLGGLSITAGSLDIVTSDPTVNVFVTGMTSSSSVPVGLTKNGQRVAFDDNGRMLQNPTTVDVTIAAKGDAVPNAPTQKVGITAEGSGENTGLAADATAVKALVQQAAVAATVAVKNGQTLTADEVAVDYSAGSLTVGETVGTGTLSTSLLRNDSPISALTVNASLGSASLAVVGIGEKKLRLVGTQASPAMSLAGGVTTIEGGHLESTGADIVVTNGAKLVFGAGAGFVAAGGAPTSTSGAIRLGTVRPGSLRIDSGAVVSNRVLTGNTSSKSGMISAVCLCGGDLYPCASDTATEFFGKYGHTYYGIHGGTLTVKDNCRVNNGDGQAHGLITQTGGTFVDLGGGGAFRYAIGSSQVTDWYLCGGSFTSKRGINLGDWGGYVNYRGVITVDGSGDFTVGTIQAAFWNGTAARAGLRVQLNVNGGGNVRANLIYRNNAYARPGQRADDRAYVNFDGGTFQSRANGYVFGNTADTSHVDRVTIFARGLRLDTNKYSPEVAVPLEAPTGNGVESVVWNDEMTDLVAPPVVKIVGSGEGATAHALLDEASGKVTNIVVTCRGWGYGADTYANVYYGYNTTPVRVEVTLAPNVSGGLTVIGGGTLQLSRTNTYAGATCVSNATLALNCPDAIDAASKLVLEKDGKLDLRNNAQTFADIETRGGTVQNGLPRVSGLTVDFAESAAGRPKAVDLSVFAFTPGAALTLANFDAAALEPNRKYALATFANGTPVLDLTSATAQLPEGWKLLLGPQKLRLVPVKGMVLIVR